MTENNVTDNPKDPIDFLLHEAARVGDIVAMTELLDNGADIEVRDRFGDNSLLGISVRNGFVEMMNLLIGRGANVNGITACCLPLHEAAGSGKVESITVLLDNGADIEGMGHSGVTPLLHAAVPPDKTADRTHGERWYRRVVPST